MSRPFLLMKIPEQSDTIASRIDAAYEAKAERPRQHLGASTLGHPCDRWLWLSFRWAVIEPFPGRVLRLFQRGQREELQVVNNLRAIGCDVQSTGANQARVDFGKHVSGSIDGIIEFGVPGAEKTPHILEIKTHSDKSFSDMMKNGVEKSKPMHWAQMQVYMLGKGLKRALYYAVNKNDDAIYTERVKLDEAAAQKFVDRGHRIAMSERMPEPISGDPTWYQCRFCAAHSFCHDTKMTKEVNCRTCAHSTPLENSTWHCAIHGDPIPADYQHQGCEMHVLRPDLVPWKLIPEESTTSVAAYQIGSRVIRNGDPDRNSFASTELVANLDACLSDEAAELREIFDARVIG